MVQDIEFKTLIDLVKVFPDEKSCQDYLSYQRWEGYITCPHEGCGHDRYYLFSDGIRYKCKKCKKQFTATTNTFMSNSHVESVKWIMAMYLVLHKKGISSVQLSKDIGVTQKTAWFMLQRIRWALGNEDDEPLEGAVMADETFVGGKNKNRHADKKVKQSQGRSFKDKTPVLGLMESEEHHKEERPHKVTPDRTVTEKVITKSSKVVCSVVPDTKNKTIQPIVKNKVSKGSVFVSDEWIAYSGLNKEYDHHIVDHSRKEYVGEHGYSTNALEGFWSLCKRSIIGIYHQTSRKHTQKYFDEFAFRYNYRNLGIQQQINKIIENMCCRLTYKELIS